MARTYEGAYPLAQGIATRDALRTELLPTEFNVEYSAQAVIQSITTNKFEGILREKGDTVNIPVLPSTSGWWTPYVIGAPPVTVSPEPTYVQLKVARGDQLSIGFNKLQQIQDVFKADVSKFAEWAIKGQVEAVNRTFFEYLAIGNTGATMFCDSHNTGNTAGAQYAKTNIGSAATPFTIDSTDDAVAFMANLRTVMAEQYVGQQDTYVVIPSLLVNWLTRSNIGNLAWIGGNTSIFEKGLAPNGLVGEKPLCGFQIYQSDLLYSDANGYIYIPFGHKEAIAFAQQFSGNRVIDDANDVLGKKWETAQIYDWKPVQAKGIGMAVATF